MSWTREYFDSLEPPTKNTLIVHVSVYLIVISIILIIYTFLQGALFLCAIQIALLIGSYKELVKALKVKRKLNHNSNKR